MRPSSGLDSVQPRPRLRFARKFFNPRAVSAVWLIGLTGALAGCVTIKEEPVSVAPEEGSAGRATEPPRPAPINTPAGVTHSGSVAAEMLPLGSIPFVEGSLPLVSPDARFLAVQTGAPPTWPTLLAEPDATVPHTTRIDIYELDLRPSLEAGAVRAPTLLTTVDRPAILGRACGPEGFLVEVPQADGSRWIGMAAWQSGMIRWLVADGRVNAFASMSAGGALAWSRRAIDAPHFDLVVRTGAEEWSLPAQGDEDWLMPTWCAAGDGLFALHLTGDRLQCTFMRASSKAAAWQSLRQLFLAARADREVAMRTLSGQVSVIGVPAMTQDQLAFLHPAWGRMTVWRPLSRAAGSPIVLAPRSFAAIIDQPDFALVTTDRQLLRQSLADPLNQMMVIRGMVIPRPTDGRPLDYILLGLGAETPDRIGLTGMKLLPVEPVDGGGKPE